MAGRNDGGLYTGATSQSFRSERAQTVAEKRLEQVKAKREQRNTMSPAAEIVKAEFAKELKQLIYGPYDNEDQMSDEQFRVERRARRLTVESVQSIQTRLMNVMRESKNVPAKEATWAEMVGSDDE
jgi:hypothetical protein